MLVDSITTRNGFNQFGAPPGKIEAMNFIGLNIIDDIINLSQRVRPYDRVRMRWLVRLKTYGVRPSRFRRIRSGNRV